MKTKSTKWTLVVLLLLAALLLPMVGACKGAAPPGAAIPTAEKTVKVGLSLCYTGALGTHGSHYADGLRDYLAWVNKEGGIEYTDPVTRKTERAMMDVIWEDNAYDPAKSVAIYKRFKGAGVQLIVGYGSTPGEAMAPSASRDKIPVMELYCYASPAGYEPKPQYYAAGFGNVVEAYMAIADWFMKNWKENRPPRLAAMALSVPSQKTLNNPSGVPAYVQKAGGVYVGTEWFPGVVTDTTVQLKRLVTDGQADFLWVWGAVGHAIIVAKDLYRMGVDTNKVTVVMAACAIDESLAKAIPKESEGIWGEDYAVTPREVDIPGVKLAMEIAKWRGKDPDTYLTKTHLEGVMQGMIVCEGLKIALEKVGHNALTTTDIRDGFFSIKDLDVMGLSHPVTQRDPGYPCFCPWLRISRCENGKYVPKTGFVCYQPVIPEGREIEK
jgi:branched-chain amino acid transport system substrate-binding protein